MRLLLSQSCSINDNQGMNKWMDEWIKRLSKVKWLHSLAGKGIELWGNERTNPRQGLRIIELSKKTFTPMPFEV